MFFVNANNTNFALITNLIQEFVQIHIVSYCVQKHNVYKDIIYVGNSRCFLE